MPQKCRVPYLRCVLLRSRFWFSLCASASHSTLLHNAVIDTRLLHFNALFVWTPDLSVGGRTAAVTPQSAKHSTRNPSLDCAFVTLSGRSLAPSLMPPPLSRFKLSCPSKCSVTVSHAGREILGWTAARRLDGVGLLEGDHGAKRLKVNRACKSSAEQGGAEVETQTWRNSPSLAPTGLVRRDSWADTGYWLVQSSRAIIRPT